MASEAGRRGELEWAGEDWKREFTEILFARRGALFVTALLVFVGAVLVAFLWPPTYRATALLLVRGAGTQVGPRLLDETETDVREISEQDVTSELEILRSPDLIKQTILDLRDQQGGAPGELQTLELAQAVRKLRQRLETEVVPSSSAIRVSLTGDDPDQIERVLDTLLDHYIRYRIEVLSPAEEAQFLVERAAEYQSQLRDVEQRIVDQTDEGEVALVQKEMENNSDLRRELNQQLHMLRAEHERQAEELKPLQEALSAEGTQLFTFIDNEAMGQLGEQLALLIQERETVARDYLPGSERVRAIDEQIEKVYALLHSEAERILVSRRSAYEATGAAIREMEESIRSLADRNIQLQSRLFEFRRLQRQSELLESFYLTYARRSEEARINSAVAESRVAGHLSILGRAESSAEVAFPKRPQTLLVGLAAAIVAALSVAMLFEYLDHTLNRPSDIHRHVGLPVIFSIKNTR